MSRWIQTFAKDVRILRPPLILGVVATLLFSILIMVKVPKSAAFLGIILSSLYLLFSFPLLVWWGLKSEGQQLHQWLHQPQPVWMLLLSKLIAALSVTFVVVIVSLVYPLYFLITMGNASQLIGIALVLVWQMVLSSLSLATLILLFWSLYHWLKNWIGNKTWLLLLLIFISLSVLDMMWIKSDLYASLTQWGEIKPFEHWTILVTNPPLYIGDYIYDFAVSIIEYGIACWIIEKKVEV